MWTLTNIRLKFDRRPSHATLEKEMGWYLHANNWWSFYWFVLRASALANLEKASEQVQRRWCPTLSHDAYSRSPEDPCHLRLVRSFALHHYVHICPARWRVIWSDTFPLKLTHEPHFWSRGPIETLKPSLPGTTAALGSLEFRLFWQWWWFVGQTLQEGSFPWEETHRSLLWGAFAR